MTIPLGTKRLRFRHLHNKDVDRLVALGADEGVLEFIDWHAPSREEQARLLGGVIDDYVRWPGYGRFAAETLDDEFIGWFALRVDDDPTRPEVGYRLHRSAWGKGFATEGSRALVDHAFDNLSAALVWAQTMFVNHRSRRVMEKCRMRRVLTWHENFDNPLPGTEHGEVRYEITRREWQSTRQRPGPGWV